MTQEVEALQIRLEATVNRFERQLSRADRTMRRRTQTMSKSAERLDKRLARVGEAFGLRIPARAAAIGIAIAAIGTALREVARNGDLLKRLEGRFTALTGSAERGAKAMAGVFDIASATGVAIDDVASSVSRFTLAAQGIGATDEEVRQLTENVLKLGQIGGASSQELASGATQLAQALASGRLQGDELRSILENMPLVAKAIAEGLGVSVGQLREMGAAGELTARRVFDAMLSKTDEIEGSFKKLPVTLDRAAGQLAASWAQFTAELDNSLGVSESLVSVLQGATSLLDGIIERRARLRAEENEARARFIAGENTDAKPVTLTPGGRPQRGPSDAQIESIAAGMDFAAVNDAATRGLTSASAAEADDALSGLNNVRLPLGRPGSAANPLDLSRPGRGGRSRRRRGGGSGRSRVDIESATRMVQAVRDRVQALNEERGSLGLSGKELERYQARLEGARMKSDLLKLAAEENTVVTAEQRASIEGLADIYVVLADNIAREREEIEANAQATKDAAKQQENLARSIKDVSSRFISAIERADNFKDALKGIAFQLAEVAAQALVGKGPLGGAFNELIGVSANGVAGLFASTSASGAATSASPVGFARGGVFSNGANVKAFAKGGVVNSEAIFPMSRGIGRIAESGPEAIMPLSRGPDGKLGVASAGGGGTTINLSVVHNISGLGMSPPEVTEVLERNNRNLVGILDDRLNRGS